MQLLIIALLLLCGNKPEMLKQVTPLLETFGGGDIKEALKSAEEMSSVISAVQNLASGGGSSDPLGAVMNAFSGSPEKPKAESRNTGFPLEPIAEIADDGIMRGLSSYIAAGV